MLIQVTSRTDIITMLSLVILFICGGGLPVLHAAHVTTAPRVIVPETPVLTVDMEGVLGRSVQLSCNVTPPGHDKVYMVFWFRDESGIPLYSFDVRGKPLVQARHWSDPEAFGSRAYFRTVSSPAQLVIDDIRLQDEGVYRCRVDFRNTPTRSFRYNLTVTIPSEQPIVEAADGRRLNTTLGPLNEGDDVVLTCRVLGGRPEPSVTWLVGGNVVDEHAERSASGRGVENRLRWPAVTRHDLGSMFTCRAANSELMEPKDVNLKLELYLKPLTVSISAKQNPLVADRRYEVTCESAGSRPPAVITWYKGKRQLRRVKEESRENSTVSELSFVPSTDDDGKYVTCRAENPNVTGAFLEDNWRIDVVYPPIVLLRLGSTLNADDIKEGDDVYFECRVQANPSWRKLTWLHNDILLSHNTSARVIRSNQSLVLQKVTRQSAGHYACAAVNSEGEGVSNKLDFRVKYAPVCRHDRILVVGASRGETLDIRCEVDADPPVLHFRWKFNNSGETLDVAAERFRTDGTSASVLRYTTASELDYGSLSCWATNDVGHQAAPCVFQVVAAGKPFPVRNCTLFNHTSSSVEVACTAGFDGGLPQHFTLELEAQGLAHSPRLNVTADLPLFLLSDLEPGITFRIAVYAVNAKGRSAPTYLEEVMFKDAEKQTASGAELTLSPVLGVALGAVLTVIALLALLGLKMRRSRPGAGGSPRGNSPPEKLARAPDTALQQQQQQQTATLGTTRAAGKQPPPRHPEHMPVIEEKDPDLIPAHYVSPPHGPGIHDAAEGMTVTLRPLRNGSAQYMREGPPAPPCLQQQQQQQQSSSPAWSPASPLAATSPPALVSGCYTAGGPVLSPVQAVGADCSTSGHGSPMSSSSWGDRPRELRLTSPSAAPAPTDLELNGVVIKERLMANRLPESCV